MPTRKTDVRVCERCGGPVRDREWAIDLYDYWCAKCGDFVSTHVVPKHSLDPGA